jgi:hypothetical protein
MNPGIHHRDTENSKKKSETGNADKGLNHGIHGIHGKTEKDDASPSVCSVYSVVCAPRIVHEETFLSS